MADQRRRRRTSNQADGARQIALSLALALLVVCAFSAFLPVFDSTRWWFDCIVVAVIVNVAAALARAAGVPRLLGSFVGAGAGVLGVTALCGDGTGIVGVLPTPRTIQHFVELSQSAGESIYRQSIPAHVDDGIAFLLVFACLMAAVSIDLMAVAAATAAPVGLIALAIVIPPSILIEEIPVIAYVVTALAYLAVLWADRARDRRQGGLTRMLAIGVVAASVAGIGAAAVPGFTGTNPFSFSTASSLASGVSPLIHLGEDLQRTGNADQFRYRTTSETPPRFRLMTLETFDGSTWKSTRERSGLFPVENGTRLVRSDTTDIPNGELVKTVVSIAGLRDKLLPLPDGAIDVHGADGSWLWDPSDETIRSRTDSTTGLDYSVSSIRTELTAEQLRAADVPDRGIFAAERELPDEIPDIISRTLDEVVEGIDNPYEKAYAIQTFLRDGDFFYSLSAPVAQGYDGDSLDVIATFLERKAGYCVHFAATMATMARMIDIPSRIVLGFLPGEEESDVVRVVTSEDLHAWPELYFEGVGWVPFEPTPGRGVAPDYAPEATSTADAAAPNDIDPRTIERSSTPTETESSEAEAVGPTVRDDEGPNLIPAGIALLGVLVLLAVPALVRSLRRSRRLSRTGARVERVAGAWAEVVDTSLDLGWQHPVSDTPRTLSDRLGDHLLHDGDAVDSLTRLVRDVERTRFGPPSETGAIRSGADARIIIRALEASASPAERLKAVVLPASLFRRGIQTTTKLAR